MQLFNKAVVVFLLLALIPVCTIGLVVPHEALDLLYRGSGELLERTEGPTSALQLVLAGLLALLINVILVGLLYFQVRRPTLTTVRINQVSAGQANVVIAALASRLEYRIDQLCDVLDVKSHISAAGNKVEVTLDIETSAESNLPTKAEQLSTVARQVIEELGLELKGKPKLNIRMAPYPALPTGSAAADPAQSPTDAAWTRPQDEQIQPVEDA